VPESPTTKTSDAELPQTFVRLDVTPLETLLHVLPSQCKIMPPFPTAKTLFEELPQTP
jgi:hypothetical protein